jgi:hypothetical protein
MGRPTGMAWRPLGLDEDPTPGDPARVTDEVSHLGSVASTILDQISALKKIAGDDSDPLIGQYADKIRESASDLVGTLQTVHDRYAKVASALGGWEPDLVTAQAMSLKALNEAEAPYQQLQVLNGPVISAPQTSPPAPPTPQQQQAAAAHTAAVNKAQGLLNDAISDLHKAVQFRDDRANYWAGQINSASHDSLKDSWWDSFKDFIGHWAWLIKDICTALEVIGAVLAIIALFATGVGWLLMVAFIVTAVALLGRTLLAATGNGSWLDVALDAFALLTLGLSGGISGVGGIVGRAGATLGDAIKVGDSIVEGARDATLSGKVMSLLGKGTDFVNGIAESMSKIPGLSMLSSMFGKAGDMLEGGAEFLADYQDAAYPLAKDMVAGLEEKSAALRALHGGEELANDVVKMNVLTKAFSDTPEVMSLAGKFFGQYNTARGLIFSGAAVSLGGLGLSGIPIYGPGDFGAEDPVARPWDLKFFDTADEALTAPIPDSFMNAVGNVVANPAFTFSLAAIP